MDLVIINSKKEAVTTSRILADKFNKQHKNVLAKIEQLKNEDKETFTGLNIKLSHYIDESGKKNKAYSLNRDAYAFFAMGFTGKQANKFKIDFIRAFNEMERWIKDRLQSSIEYKVMQAILKDSRKLIGKETKSHHYSNEAKLVNWALRGEFKGVDRETLTLDEINLLNELQTRNAVLIGAGMTREQRKESLHLMVELGRSDLLECA
jgi:Rha family phage regulatory protein